MCVGFAIVSMVGTNFHDSKLIKGDSAPGPNEIGPRARVRSGPIGPRPIFLSFFRTRSTSPYEPSTVSQSCLAL